MFMCFCEVISILNQANKTTEKFDCFKIFSCRSKLIGSVPAMHDIVILFEIEFNHTAFKHINQNKTATILKFSNFLDF